LVGSLFGYLVIFQTYYLSDTVCGSCWIHFKCLSFLAECSFVCGHRCVSETCVCLRITGTVNDTVRKRMKKWAIKRHVA